MLFILSQSCLSVCKQELRIAEGAMLGLSVGYPLWIVVYNEHTKSVDNFGSF